MSRWAHKRSKRSPGPCNRKRQRNLCNNHKLRCSPHHSNSNLSSSRNNSGRRNRSNLSRNNSGRRNSSNLSSNNSGRRNSSSLSSNKVGT